jgi:deoxyribonuclease V
MKIGKSHPQWQGIIDGWRQTQHDLRLRMIVAPLDPLPRFVAGADCAFSKDGSTVFAAAVIYDREDKRIVEVRHATAPADVPYIPTFLSFREAPALTKAIASLQHPFGVICFDGQGIAHPRRCGLATHMGVTLNVPSIGVAKTRLIGTFDEPAKAGGSFAPLMDEAEQIGVVLRTRTGINPLFISIGHRVDLPSAIALLMACVKHRIPEPTRQADIEVDKLKSRLSVVRSRL